MKWIKNGNQLINMAHVSDIRLLEEIHHQIIFYGERDYRLFTLKYENEATAEAHLEAIAMFLENSHTTIMAMSPTQED